MNINRVSDEEKLARFILEKRWIRKTDNTLKPEAFLPYSRIELSVTRIDFISNKKLMEIGCMVASIREKYFYGSGILKALDIRNIKLKIKATPLSNNKYHADIINYPMEKAEQKMLAIELAGMCSFNRN